MPLLRTSNHSGESNRETMTEKLESRIWNIDIARQKVHLIWKSDPVAFLEEAHSTGHQQLQYLHALHLLTGAEVVFAEVTSSHKEVFSERTHKAFTFSRLSFSAFTLTFYSFFYCFQFSALTWGSSSKSD